MELLKRLFGVTPIIAENKDPKDYKKCKLSTNWGSDDHYCNVCKKSTTTNEYLSAICNGCGSFNTQVRFGRSYRKIYINGMWKYQIRYKEGTEEMREGWY